MFTSSSAALVLAHDEGGLGDAGLSSSLVIYVSVAMLAVVALGLRAGWTTVRFSPWSTDEPDDRRVGPGPIIVAARAVTLALLALVLVIGFTGSPTSGANPVPPAVYAAFWFGGLLVSALFGDLWSLVHPAVTVVDLVDQVLGRDQRTSTATAATVGHRVPAGVASGPRLPDGLPDQPPVLGDDPTDDGLDDDLDLWWVPALLLTGFVVLWICWPGGVRPRPTAVFVTVWLVTMLAGGLTQGADWIRRHDPFSVLFSAAAGCAPVRWVGGRPSMVNPVRHLASRLDADRADRAGRNGRAAAAVLALVLGAVLFDGVRVTRGWADLVGSRSLTSLGVVSSVAFLWITLLVAAAWLTATRLVDRISNTDDTDDISDTDDTDDTDDPLFTALRFAPALAAVVVADRLAHGLERFLISGQNLLSLASDPFADGADLLGTVDWVDHPILSAPALAWIGLSLLLAGHLMALVVLHDGSVARFGPAIAARTIWPLTVILSVSLVIALQLFGI